MSMGQNPFYYEGATDLAEVDLLDYYCEDFSYSRFVLSRRNVFLAGERGTGKTMVLRYYSLPVQQLKAAREKKRPDMDVVGIYVPCMTPLISKREQGFMAQFPASVVLEHLFVLDMIRALADSLLHGPDLLKGASRGPLEDAASAVFPRKEGWSGHYLESIRDMATNESIRAQKVLNSTDAWTAYEDALSFSTGVLPLLYALRGVPALAQTHFTFLIDDAHSLQPSQRATLNSWVSFRDHSLFSFKIAIARSDWGSFETASGGAILEGHDYITVEMEQPYQNKFSEFGKLAREIVERRLERLGLGHLDPEHFFPVNDAMRADLDECRSRAADEARLVRGLTTKKQVNDYVYKHARAMYFRERSSKANRPPYSGFETLVHLSTGVIRYLLEPCYRMYEAATAEQARKGGTPPVVSFISPSIQTDVIMELSRRWWNRLRDGLDNTIAGCSGDDARQLYRLFDQLAVLFWKRMKMEISEPRATTFSISEDDPADCEKLKTLLAIARKAQFLYAYSSVAKSQGRREYYYVPNRLLWPDRGLDPIGQNARVSLRASELVAAAQHARALRWTDSANHVEGLFHEL
jgi:hypothetical protein